MAMVFTDRREGGRVLADRLSHYEGRDDVVVLGLPRGGVPVAYEIARALQAPLDVLVVRKLGVPGHEELAMGAIASGGLRQINEDLVRRMGVSAEAVDTVAETESREVERREQRYRGDRPAPEVGGKVAIVADDGLATGATMKTSVAALRRLDPARIVVAVPTGAGESCAELEQLADEVVCASIPEPFYAVGMHYRNFDQTTDDEVRHLLDAAAGATR